MHNKTPGSGISPSALSGSTRSLQVGVQISVQVGVQISVQVGVQISVQVGVHEMGGSRARARQPILFQPSSPTYPYFPWIPWFSRCELIRENEFRFRAG